jgi:ComF family protein
MFDLLRRTVNLQLPSRLTIVQILTSVLAPPVCALCGGRGQRLDEPWGLDLCTHCEAACPRLPAACPRCAEPGEAGECRRCASAPPPFDATHALLLYADPADQLITGLKFQGELPFARVLGSLFARELRHRGVRLPHCLVPMPLHGNRYRQRGFNQAEAIGRHLARRLGIPLEPTLLVRTRDTAPQSEQSAAARRANIQSAFAVEPGRRVPPRVALLDDVMTTGSTAAAAAAALRAAGARHVEIWACARAPPPLASDANP